MTDRIRDLVRNTVNAEIINAICDEIDSYGHAMQAMCDVFEKRIKALEEQAKKKNV